MPLKRALWVDQKPYKKHTQKIFCSKDIINQKVNKTVTSNLPTNHKTREKSR